MPLVPLKVIEKWYIRDSWVYRNFAYIFVNPIWSRKIPKGRGVCVYFWSALIIGSLVRALVGVVYTAGFLARGLGRALILMRLPNLLRKTDKLGMALLRGYFTDIPPLAENETPGLATFLGLFFALIALILLAAIEVPSILISQTAWAEHWLITDIMVEVVILTFLICQQYRDRHRKNRDGPRCKVEWYERLSIVLLILATIAGHPHEIGSFLRHVGRGTKTLLGVLWSGATAIPWGLWVGIKWVGWALAWTAKWVGFIIVWCFSGAGHLALHFGPKILLCVGIPVIAVALLGPLLAKLFPERVGDAPVDNPVAEKPLSASKIKGTERSILGLIGGQNYHGSSANRRAFEDYIARTMSGRINDMARRTVSDGFDWMFVHNDDGLTELERVVVQAEREWKARMAELDARQKRRDELCDKFTRTIGLIFTPITWPVKMVFNGLVIIMVKIGRGIARVGHGLAWAGVQVWTFLCLLWELAKARKKGACPYIEFRDPDVKEPVKPVLP